MQLYLQALKKNPTKATLTCNGGIGKSSDGRWCVTRFIFMYPCTEDNVQASIQHRISTIYVSRLNQSYSNVCIISNSFYFVNIHVISYHDLTANHEITKWIAFCRPIRKLLNYLRLANSKHETGTFTCDPNPVFWFRFQQGFFQKRSLQTAHQLAKIVIS